MPEPYDPCAAGCLLGLGSRCCNLPQPWRPLRLWRICYKIHVEGHAAFLQQTLEWTERPPSPAPTEDPPTVSIEQAAERLALVRACDYRGPQTQSGCNCLNICYAGRGKRAGGGPGHEVSRRDCVECVSSSDWP